MIVTGNVKWVRGGQTMRKGREVVMSVAECTNVKTHWGLLLELTSWRLLFCT